MQRRTQDVHRAQSEVEIMKTAWKQTVFMRLAVTFLLVTAPIYAIGISIHNWGVRSIRTELNNSRIAQATFYLSGLETEMERIKLLQRDCITDDNLNDLTYAAPIMDEYSKVQAMLRLQQRLYSIKNSSRYIQEVSAGITGLNKTISAVDGVRWALDEQAVQSLHYPLLSAHSQLSYDGQTLYSNVANLYANTAKGRFAFLITIRLSRQALADDLKLFGDGSRVVLMTNAAGDFCYLDGAPENEWEKMSRELLDQAARQSSGAYFQSIGGIRHAAVYTTNDLLGLTLAQYIPESEVLSGIKDYQAWFWLYSIVSVAIILLFSLSLYRLIHKPLRDLVLAFKEVEGGHFDIRIHYSHRGEFRYLFHGFNGMVKNLGALIDQVYKQKILMQNAQLKQLQAQINPHFLYNTFFILYSMAEAEDNQGVMLFLKQLGNYFKYITRDGEDEVSLSREVAHARIYADIQQLRFSNRLKITFEELPAPFSDIRVPRLIIQPILENAFKYGLENKESGGLLHVSFCQEGSMLHVIVDDNGGGVTDEKLRQLQKGLDGEGLEGEVTGTMNIHRRLRLKFGPASGLKISVNEQGGLRAELIMDLEGTGHV